MAQQEVSPNTESQRRSRERIASLPPIKCSRRELGKRIRAIRVVKGLKVASLDGINLTTCTNVERGRRSTYYVTYLKFAKALGIDYGVLVGDRAVFLDAFMHIAEQEIAKP